MANSAMGTKLKKGTTAVAELTSIGGLELSADTTETTTLDSPDGYRTFTQGLKDAGEVSISGYFDPTAHQGLLTDFESGAETAYTIEFPFGAKWEFNAIVTGYSTGAEMEDNVSFESTLKVSGKPKLTVGAGA
ncbi:phage tail tube protein [Bacillus sp. B-jedd]|uniref:phage tail tube protein n=1 Tax=Bacillus sp. B-jedd TaxID=1476857 RepID=UPI000515603C|nr:phage tail tube protein [Bacillus sp. B-jedd]CEG26011.1 Phage major tail protein 2 [Bacillus sp. B-jedd]